MANTWEGQSGKGPPLRRGWCRPFSAKPYRGMVWETSEGVRGPTLENPYCNESLSLNVAALMLSFTVTHYPPWCICCLGPLHSNWCARPPSKTESKIVSVSSHPIKYWKVFTKRRKWGIFLKNIFNFVLPCLVFYLTAQWGKRFCQISLHLSALPPPSVSWYRGPLPCVAMVHWLRKKEEHGPSGSSLWRREPASAFGIYLMVKL